MTDSLNPASLQKLHKLDERAGGVPGALFDHLDLTDGHAGKRGKACSRVTTSLADGAESFGGHLGEPCKKRGSGGFIDFAATPAVVRKSLNAPFKTLASCLAADKFAAGFVMARAVLGNRGPVFHRFNVHSNSPKSKGAGAPSAHLIHPVHFSPLIRKHVKGLKLLGVRITSCRPCFFFAIVPFGCSYQFRMIEGYCAFWRFKNFQMIIGICHLSISVPDETFLTHNVHSVKHKVRANDDLLREAA